MTASVCNTLLCLPTLENGIYIILGNLQLVNNAMFRLHRQEKKLHILWWIHTLVNYKHNAMANPFLSCIIALD